MSRSIEGRISKLEQFSKPEHKCVFHLSDPPTLEEEEAIANAAGPIVIVPLLCKTVEEWIAKYAPKVAMQ
jgi:hypothetical protein